MTGRIQIYRRTALKTVAAGLSGLSLATLSRGASEFWRHKQPADWSAQEVAQLLSRSPWAKEVNADFTADLHADSLRVGRGGTVEAAPQIETGRDAQTGARRREPVTVRWESARPIREAGGIPLSPTFKDRYVLSVSGLLSGIMEKNGGAAGDRQRMIEQLTAAATLETDGQAPEQPGVVMPAPRAPGTYLFGFSKELLPLGPDTREILFTLRTALITIKAKFESKTMTYRGEVAF